MIKLAKYNGKILQVKSCSRERFDLLIEDAKIIMGMAPAKSSRVAVCTAQAPEKFLCPPDEGGETWLYAQRLLRLEWPAIYVFDRHYFVVSESDVQYI